MNPATPSPAPAASPEVRLLGYVAPVACASLTPKQVVVIWEGQSGSAGRAWWTGAFWAVRPWSDIRPVEHAALKRVVPRAKLARLTYLGDSDLLALWKVAGHRPSTGATDAQRAYLAKQGVRIPTHLPRLLASESLDLLALARTCQDPQAQWIGTRPDPAALTAALDALRRLSSSTPAESWAHAIAEVARCVAPPP
jgi:hypothetical protein